MAGQHGPAPAIPTSGRCPRTPGQTPWPSRTRRSQCRLSPRRPPMTYYVFRRRVSRAEFEPASPATTPPGPRRPAAAP